MEVLVAVALLHFRVVVEVVLVLLVQQGLDQLLERGVLDRNPVLLEQQHIMQVAAGALAEPAQQVDWVELEAAAMAR
jgi:hypothetical protein